MRPTQVAPAINLLCDLKQPGFVWGPPGAGKSDLMKHVAKSRDEDLIDIRLSMLDPTDLKGFPIADHEKQVMRWLTADFLPSDPKWKGIVFFDEANAAPKSVEAPMYQLTLDRKLGDYKLPDGASIMMAGNRETDRAIANRMSAALQNRLIHIDYDVNLDDWIAWAIDHGIKDEMIAFMHFRAELLLKFDPNSKAWPSPRSWAMANKLLNSGLPRDTEFQLFKGTVGEGAAGEFAAFIQVYENLPTIESILAKPQQVRVPEDPATLYAVATAIAAAAKADNFDRLMEYATRMALEYQVVFVRDAVRRRAPIDQCRSLVQWSIDNADVLS